MTKDSGSSKFAKWYFEQYAEAYTKDADNLEKRDFINRLIAKKLAYQFKNKRILELGGGVGYFGQYFCKSNCSINVDLSYPFLKEAKDRHQMICVQADISFLPFKEHSFDGVISCGVLVYLNSRQLAKTISDCWRILKPGGRIVFHEALEYVRWYKTYLRLLKLNRLEPLTTKMYQKIAKWRGMNEICKKTSKHPALYLRTEESYEEVLTRQGFRDIRIRFTFLNILPPRLEKYLWKLTYQLSALFKNFKNIQNGILVTAEKPGVISLKRK